MPTVDLQGPTPGRRVRLADLLVITLAVAVVAIPVASAAGVFGDDGSGTSKASKVAAGANTGSAATHQHAAGTAVRSRGAQANEASVTPEQRAAADKLLANTKSGLWQWADDAKVEAAGFRTIGDGFTGTEHLLNWNWINDDKILDPSHPESLVYRTTPKGRVLEAAMYMLPVGTADTKIPDIGGTLTQWHVHDNLCMSPPQLANGFAQRFVVGLTSATGGCDRGEKLPTVQMLHVWVVPHKCGPFAALDGIGAGTSVKEAQDPNTPVDCQHGH